nr:MAG TPA: R-SPONDIN-1 PROTEIN, ADULT STEM CELL.0A [Caudoviricetes sp.]
MSRQVTCPKRYLLSHDSCAVVSVQQLNDVFHH